MKLKYQYSIYLSFLFVIILGIPFFTCADDQTYQLITMEFAPYNYTENGQLSGICTDIVREILKRVGHPDNIRSYPLARAYMMLEKEDNIIVFSRLRTPDREKQNKWVGPLMPFRMVLYAKKNTGINISTIEDAKKYRVGCSIDSGAYHLLLKHGFTQIDQMPKGAKNSMKLERGWIDLWITAELIGKYGALLNHVDPKQFEVVYEFQPVHSLYIAFSNTISDKVVAEWQKALDELKQEGIYDDIFNKYIEKLNQ